MEIENATIKLEKRYFGETPSEHLSFESQNVSIQRGGSEPYVGAKGDVNFSHVLPRITWIGGACHQNLLPGAIIWIYNGDGECEIEGEVSDHFGLSVLEDGSISFNVK